MQMSVTLCRFAQLRSGSNTQILIFSGKALQMRLLLLSKWMLLDGPSMGCSISPFDIHPSGIQPSATFHSDRLLVPLPSQVIDVRRLSAQLILIRSVPLPDLECACLEMVLRF
jgi:hypothetical protein